MDTKITNARNTLKNTINYLIDDGIPLSVIGLLLESYLVEVNTLVQENMMREFEQSQIKQEPQISEDIPEVVEPDVEE